jgi:hypothetical protein
VTRLYVAVLAAHVLVAVLGLGSVASVAVVAAVARRAGRASVEVSASLGPLLRYSASSLAAMLITGILLDLAAGGAFHGTWWFRISALLLIAAGALHGQARRAVRQGLAKENDGEAVLRRVEHIAWGMCSVIAMITVLMEVKPF